MFLVLFLVPFALSESAAPSQPIPNAAIAQFLPMIFTKFLPFFASPVKVNSNANLPEDFLLTDALIKNRGYGYEYYKVTTEDGYILSLHRILSKNPDVTKPPVLIQHGVLASSDSWVVDPNTSLAFTLSDNGYDVWLSDQRGSAYSKGHKYYSVKEFQYWNFTFHEAGLYDIPAFIDKIIEVTGKPQIYYIGHSMGTTVFLTMASLRPEYNDKVKAAVLLAPVATTPTLSELFQTVLRLLILYSDSIRESLILRKAYEFMPRSGETIKAIRKSCDPNSPTIDFCLDVIGMAYGEDRLNLDRKTIGKSASYLPTGTSINTVHHLSQIYKNGNFVSSNDRKVAVCLPHSYGKLKNMKIYGSFDPPFYPLGDIKIPIALFYGDNDTLMNRRSAEELASKLQNLLLNVKVSDPKFTHTDFIFGQNAKEIVYKEIVGLLELLDSMIDVLYERRIFEILPRSPKVIEYVENECKINSTSFSLCLDVYGLVFGENRQNIDYGKVEKYFKYIPTGSSLRNFLHFGQLYRNDAFRMYDYGKETNLKYYGTDFPPFYPLENVRAPVAIFYGLNDAFISEISAQKLANSLPNLVLNKRVDDPKFTHYDYIYGKNAKDAVHNEIVKLFDFKYFLI